MNFTPDTWWLFGIVATAAVGMITYFLKRTMNKQDCHDDDINHIKLTYVTKDDLKDVKSEFAKNTDKLQKDVEEIKANCLTKKDFIYQQTKTDQKIDKIYDLLVQGGTRND